MHVDFGHVNNSCDREDYGRSKEALECSRHHLPHGHQPDRQRGKDSILDLFRVAELLDHRQGDCLYALKHDGEPDHSGNKYGRKARGSSAGTSDRGADLGEDIEKDEHQQEGLKDRPRDEDVQVLAKNQQISHELNFESCPTR